MYTFNNLNQALIGMSKELITKGVKRKTRGFSCIELPNPVLICINNPTDRYITIPERKWNKFLPFVESLWLALGINDLDSLPGNYVKSLYNFSDDGKYWRAAYGPRLRYYSGHGEDYKISDTETAKVFSGGINHTDQIKFVIESLKRDINSRQAVISVSDPSKDCFNKEGELKVTKDYPCTRSIHFQVNTEGKLDCIVDLRSNDILWGLSAINVFNFTFMQEYVANIVGVPVGNYYHKADNIHYYENFQEKIEEFANLNPEDYKTGEFWAYSGKIGDLSNFDRLIGELYQYEKELRLNSNFYIKYFGNDMFNDWGKIFYHYHTKQVVNFKNPYLVKLFGFENIDFGVYSATYPSNKDIVGVWQGSNMKAYPIDISVKGYIRKCAEDGKKAVYLGMSDYNGILTIK